MSLLLSIFVSLVSLVSFTPEQEAKIIASSCYLYSESSFSSECVTYQDQPVILKNGDMVEIVADEGQFVKVKIASKVVEGYVYRYYISATNAQDVYPTFNATLRTNSNLYSFDLEQVLTSLEEGTRLFLYDGYDDKQEFIPVTVVLEDGTLANGLVATSDIKPDGISSLLIVGITIIAACVTVLLSLIFIKKYKNNKKTKNKI